MSRADGRPIRIGYTCHDAFPSGGANTQQIFWTLSEVARLGGEVVLTVPALSVTGGDWRSAVAAHYGARAETWPDRFRIASAGCGAPSGPLARGLFDLTVPGRLRAARYDVVWTRDPVAAVACVRAALPVVFETYRPDFATRRRFAPWRRACLGSRHLRGLIAHTRMAAEAFVAAGVPPARCLVARNGFAPSTMEPALAHAEARRRTGLPAGGALVVYAGRVGPHKGLDVLVRAAALLPDATFVLLGADPAADAGRWIARVAREAGASNIVLRAPVPAGSVAPYLYAADLLIVPPYDDPDARNRRRMLPIKVFSYLAAGRPIVAPRMPDIEEVLTERTARLVTPFDVLALATAIGEVLSNGGLREQLGANARAASAGYTWAGRAQLIVPFLRGIAG